MIFEVELYKVNKVADRRYLYLTLNSNQNILVLKWALFCICISSRVGINVAIVQGLVLN